MSTKNKLLDMTQDLDASLRASVPQAISQPFTGSAGIESTQRPPPLSPVFPNVPKTGPGQMLAVRSKVLAAEAEVDALKDQLREHEGSTPTRLIDPKAIVPSAWANRHPDTFITSEFADLKASIEASGGNTLPIAVRPIAGQAGRYEIVYGHCRHQACLQLGIMVKATIETSIVEDLQLFSAMNTENLLKKNLSPWEQGMMYRKALNSGLFPSNRRLAEHEGLSHTWVASVLTVADLPKQIVECFRSPLEIKFRHAKAIEAALERDKRSVLRRAEALRNQSAKPGAGAVVADLLASATDPAQHSARPIEIAGKKCGKWFRDAKGRLNIQLNSGSFEDLGSAEVAAAITSALTIK